LGFKTNGGDEYNGSRLGRGCTLNGGDEYTRGRETPTTGRAVLLSPPKACAITYAQLKSSKTPKEIPQLNNTKVMPTLFNSALFPKGKKTSKTTLLHKNKMKTTTPNLKSYKLHNFTVIGHYDDGETYCNTFEAKSPRMAEKILEDMGITPDLVIPGNHNCAPAQKNWLKTIIRTTHPGADKTQQAYAKIPLLPPGIHAYPNGDPTLEISRCIKAKQAICTCYEEGETAGIQSLKDLLTDLAHLCKHLDTDFLKLARAAETARHMENMEAKELKALENFNP
jgi:hypothetical protein